jgi:hypothetical protein
MEMCTCLKMSKLNQLLGKVKLRLQIAHLNTEYIGMQSAEWRRWMTTLCYNYKLNFLILDVSLE